MGLLSGLKAQSKSILVRLTQATVEGVTFPFGGRGTVCTAKQSGHAMLAGYRNLSSQQSISEITLI